MSKLEELIQELCPNGVEYKTLGEIATIARGGNFQKKDYCEVGVPCIHYGQIYTQYGLFTDSTLSYISPEVAKKQKMAMPNDIIMAVTSENIDDVCKCVAWLGAEQIAVSGHTAIIHHNQNTKFLTYYFHTAMFHEQKRKLAHGTKVIEVTPNKLNGIKIPIPPLPVQSEIVRILDNFTELTAELQEELQARKKQYEYYHNALMDFSNENIEYLSVGELFEIKNGLNKEKAAFGKGKPIINFTDVYNNRWLANGSFSGLVDVLDDEIKRYSAKIGDVFFTRTSETKEDIGMSSTLVENVPNCVFSGFVLRARPTTNLLLPKFCSYYFSTKQVRNTIVRYAAFTTRATTTGQKLSKIIVPILPIERQRRIVAILDRFYALCNDLTSGLPAEIEARQKQYEYYRDKLLSFHPLSQP